jgi:hypothetical protein
MRKYNKPRIRSYYSGGYKNMLLYIERILKNGGVCTLGSYNIAIIIITWELYEELILEIIERL